ncbi:RNA 2',3'-cyclic phosphodiesterase [uncultured Microbulbifer sp.]|uniref:RNA 2',3'-cyclic phosphodiesterase n=1 Tax=uncultured Microbulbifer sp. TaxID=348147 RepID=UPI0025E14910|nr:RNA 2',3'-cyclic phosphodiesterase [uncultured Microbulbifer sp.]
MADVNGEVRLFIGVEPDRATQKFLDATVEHLRRLSLPRDARWIGHSNRHLTLAFLGEVASTQVEDIESRLQATASRHPALFAQAVCTQPFPKQRSRLLATELLPNPELDALHRDCRQLMLDIGIPPESASYRPHFTLARSRRGFSRLQPLPASHLCHLDNLVLYHSLLAPGGSQYSKLCQYALSG